MNLETTSSKKPLPVHDEIDFDFKPITSGLGFHSNKTTEIKPAFAEKPLATQPSISMPVAPVMRKENQIYQSDLSIFYGKEATPVAAPVEEVKEEKVYRAASKTHRFVAYMMDMALVLACLAGVLVVMSKIIDMELIDMWNAYPNEITPLVITLFCGFYLIYFSIFEKTASSTLGKNVMGITVVNLQNRSQSFSMLLLRSFVTLVNFVSLGLFSYFDLQNKISNSKVIKAE